jgi:phosphoribosylamine--glycine ligase
MKVLLVGGGGREHALAWKLAASPLCTQLWIAPGNAGTLQHGENVPIAADDVPALVAFARAHEVDLVVAGPEAPLVAGLADRLSGAGVRCFGPSAAAARLEGSKAFMKSVADAAGIPTARWARFTDAASAANHVRAHGAPIVVKADGLAAGKGVVVAATIEEALAAIEAALVDRVHGDSGAAIVVEEYLAGEEISVFALCDGTHAIPLGAAQDHKRVGDGDTGPNTGGMGAFCPPPAWSQALETEVMARFIRPTLSEMRRRDAPFQGVLFAGLMLTATGPRLLEYNVRFGDPECQALLLRLRSDLLPALLAAVEGRLGEVALDWSEEAAMVVVMAARGYPGAYAGGSVIGGLDQAARVPGARIFHAGTVARHGQVMAAGGRVLSVGGTGATLGRARDAAYAAVDAIDWPEGFCRRDIGRRALG